MKKQFYSILSIILFSILLCACGNMYSYEDIENIKKQAIEDAKEDILEEYALNYVKENYTPEEVYPEKIILNRSKADPKVSAVHGTLPKNSKPEDGYLIINKKSKVFHHSDCPSVSKMKETNKQVSNRTATELIEQGYSPCGNESW